MADVLTIGRTHYYTVRKGTQQYRVAEGKRLADPDCCWLVLKDRDSGKTYYVNNVGVRRWHLPDIYQSEAERAAEEEELRFRRERKIAEEKGEDKSQTAADAKSDAAKSEVDDLEGLLVDYGARDQAALKLKPNREWEELEPRREVFKHAKATLAPMAAKGEVSDELFPTIVSTVCHEFFSKNNKFGEAQKKLLAAETLKYAQARIEEQHVQEAFRKMNKELLDKIKRIDGERKAANARIVALQQQEEGMKAEIFNLRGHKQDTLLSSFKRLTRAGLIKTYWQRWKTFKGIVEAQLHVRARERRALEMKSRNEELEAEVDKLNTFVKQLQDRVQQAEGRDVIAMLLKQSGLQLVHRYFTNWRRFSLESIKEKQFYDAREQILNCPNCELRETDNQRVRARLHESFRAYRETVARLHDKETECEQLKTMVAEKAEFAALQESMATAANATAAAMSKKVLECDDKLWSASLKQQQLESEIERLQFEIMGLSDFSADGLKGKDGAQGAVAVNPYAVSRGGGGGGGGGGNGVETTRSLGAFFAQESDAGATKLRSRLTARTQALSSAAAHAEAHSQSVVMTAAAMRDGAAGRRASPYRGAVRPETEAALAPLVRAMPTAAVQPETVDYRNAGPPSEAAPESLLYRRPLSDSGSDSDSDDTRKHSSSDSDAPPPPPEEEDPGMAQCARCGFRKKLTPFCPKDGTRHVFEGFAGGGDVLRALQPDQSEAAYTLAHRRTLKDKEMSGLPAGLPPPEYRQSASRPGMSALSGERSAVLPDGSQSLGSMLRGNAPIDPAAYDPRRAVQMRHTTAAALENDSTDLRAVAEHVRNTRMAIERRTQDAQAQGRTVVLPSGHVPLSEFRRGGEGHQVTELASGIGLRAQTAPSPHRTQRASWRDVFDYNDQVSDSLGIGTGSVSTFGVYRGSEGDSLRQQQEAVPAQRLRTEQRGTPSMQHGRPGQ